MPETPATAMTAPTASPTSGTGTSRGVGRNIDPVLHTGAPIPTILQLVTDGDRVAGAERVLLELAAHVDRKRFRLHFVTLGPAGEFAGLLAQRGVEVTSLELTRPHELPRAALRLARLLRRERPALVHAHLHHAAVLATAVAPLCGARVLQTRHYSDYLYRFGTRVRQRTDRWAVHRCEAVLAVSEAARDHMISAEGVPAARIQVVPNGIDWERLSSLDPAEGRARLHAAGVGPGPGPIMLCAATFDPRKGHPVLIEAMATVHARHPEARLVLLGVGKDQPDIEARVRARGLSDCVHFLGYRDDAERLIAGCDVYLQPSLEEAFGIAVLEAMAARRPVVVSDIGGMQVTVLDEQTGLRVPPGDPTALAEALSRVLRDPALQARLGAAGSLRVRDHYSSLAMVRAYEAAWDRLLASPRYDAKAA